MTFFKYTVLATLAFITTASYAQHEQLSLAVCQGLALQQNKKVTAARYNLQAAQAAHSSVAATAYPTVDGSLLGLYIGDPIGGALNGAIPEYLANGAVTSSQVIYAGGKIRHAKTAAEKVVNVSQAQQQQTEAEVLFAVEKAYWQVVQVQEKITLATRYRDMLKTLQQDLKNTYNAGLIYKNDLLRVDVNLNNAELDLTQAHDALVLAKLTLAQTIGTPGHTTFSVADSISGTFLPRADTLLPDAESRPEIKALKSALEADKLQQKILTGDRLPTIGVSVTGLAVTGKSVNLSNGKDFMASYYGMASITIPLTDWGKRAHKVKEQSYRIAAHHQQLEETHELINIEIQQAYLQLNQSAQKVRLSDMSLLQAQENLRLTNDRFLAGTIVGKDVQEAQALWQQAYSQVIDARIAYTLNTAAYRKATGTLKAPDTTSKP